MLVYLKETKQVVEIDQGFLDVILGWFPALSDLYFEITDFKQRLLCGANYCFESTANYCEFVKYFNASIIISINSLKLMQSGYLIENNMMDVDQENLSNEDSASFFKSDEFQEYLKSRNADDRANELYVNTIYSLVDAELEILRVSQELAFNLFDPNLVDAVKKILELPQTDLFNYGGTNLSTLYPNFLAINVKDCNKVALIHISGSDAESEYLAQWFQYGGFPLERSDTRENAWDVETMQDLLDWINALRLNFNFEMQLATVIQEVNKQFDVQMAESMITKIKNQIATLKTLSNGNLVSTWSKGLNFLNDVMNDYAGESYNVRPYSKSDLEAQMEQPSFSLSLYA